MLLSIVTTLYQSENFIGEFLQRISATVELITEDYEIILVNDGSTDQSLPKALSLQKNYPNVTIINLSRNFGHHEAGLAGLAHAKGDYIFLIDSDLEESPELLTQFWQAMQDQSNPDVVYGVQEKRKGNGFERLSGSLFYKLFNHISEIQIPANLLTVRLMKKEFVEAVLQYPEKNVFLAGLMALAGFNQQAITVHKFSKKTGTYTFSKQIKLFITCITAFSTKPLEYIFVVGALLTFFTLLTGVFYGIKVASLQDQSFSSWPLIIMSIGFLSGIIIMCTGILGIYLAKIYVEVKQRPRAIIKKIYYRP